MPVSVTNPALSTLTGLLIFDVKIDGEAVNLTSSEVQQATVANIEAQHEAAVITTQLTKAQISRFVDKPITFRYGGKLDASTWYGYVVSVEPNRDFEVDTVVDINCIGPTWPMQNGTPKFVRNITAPDMFAAIVTGGFRQDVSTGYNLGAQVDTHSFSWPSLAQSDESDWQYLITLGERIGYAVYNYRGVVRLVKPLRVLNETPIFQSYIKGDNVLDVTRVLLDWSAQTQSLDLRGNIRPSFGFFDGPSPSTSQQVFTNGIGSSFPQGASPVLGSSVTNNPPSVTQLLSPYRLRTDTPVRDRQMAVTYSEGWMNRIDFWNQQAMARIRGNAQIVPGVNIAVQVSGTPNGRNEYDGVWMVRGVKHSFTHNSFQTQLDLARDTNSVPVNTKDKWFWNVSRGAPKMLLDPVTNKWKSSWGASPEFINVALNT